MEKGKGKKKPLPAKCAHMPGNNYWEKRKTHGRPKNIKTPKELWDLACEYFKYVDSNPWIKNEAVKGGDSVGMIIQVPTARPYTWTGFEDYLFEKNVIQELKHYRYNDGKRFTDFIPIIEKINNVIYTQKFEGASVGAFNANIIARDLGLIERTENTNKNETIVVEIKKKKNEN